MLKQNKRDPKQFYFTTNRETEEFLAYLNDEELWEQLRIDCEDEIPYIYIPFFDEAVKLFVYVNNKKYPQERFRVLCEVKGDVPVFADLGEWLTFETFYELTRFQFSEE